MEKKPRALTKWLYWFLFAVAVITVYKTLDNFTDILNFIKDLFNTIMPFFMGILISYLLYLPCSKVEKTYKKTKIKFINKRARIFSVITVYIIAILILIILINCLIPYLAKSVTELTKNIGSYYNSAITAIENIPEDSFFYNLDLLKSVDKLKNVNLDQYLDLENLAQYAKSAIGFMNSLVDVFVSFIVSVYVLIERAQILDFIRKIVRVTVDDKKYNTISKYFYKSNAIFFKFLTSQIIDAIIVGILTSIAMSILGVKYAILLGVIIGVSNLIPYFGAIVGVGFAILLTIFSGGISQAIWLAIVVIILQQIDANIINPKIVGNSLEISPLLVIFAVTIGGAYFGMLGMFLAVPFFTVIKAYIVDYVEYKSIIKNKEEKVKES